MYDRLTLASEDAYEHLFPSRQNFENARNAYRAYRASGGTRTFLDWLTREYWVVTAASELGDRGDERGSSSGDGMLEGDDDLTKDAQNSHRGTVSGRPTRIPPKSDTATRRALELENESAPILADGLGTNIEQNPSVSGNKNPDYKDAETGRTIDAYSPSGSNVNSISRTAANKINSGQADDVVINLSDSETTVEQLRDVFTEYPPAGNIYVIDQEGSFFHLWRGEQQEE